MGDGFACAYIYSTEFMITPPSFSDDRGVHHTHNTFMMMKTSLVWCLAILSLFSRNEAFVSRRLSLPTGYGRVVDKQEVVKSRAGSRLQHVLPPALAVRGGGGKVQQVDTQAELEQILSTSGDSLVVIDFTATWCSPCQKIAPAFEQLSQELAEVVFVKVDVDENEETAQKYDVFQMPTFLFMKKGEVVEQFSGADIGVLRQKIDGLL